MAHFSEIFDFQQENKCLFFTAAFCEYGKFHMDVNCRHAHSVSGSTASPHRRNYFAVFLSLIEKISTRVVERQLCPVAWHYQESYYL